MQALPGPLEAAPRRAVCQPPPDLLPGRQQLIWQPSARWPRRAICIAWRAEAVSAHHAWPGAGA
eukprot:5366171-Alexandrium_andersonii.AAC.1